MASKLIFNNANGIPGKISLVNPDSNNKTKELDISKLTTYVDTVDDLASLTYDIGTVIVSNKDRGGIFNAIGSTTANDGTIFDGSGCSWERQYSGAVNVKWFSVIADNELIDNADTLEYVFNNFNNIYIPDGKYNINRGIIVDKLNGGLQWYYARNLYVSQPSLTINGETSEKTIISCSSATIDESAIIYFNGNNGSSTDNIPEIINLNISNLTILGSGMTGINEATYQGIELKAVWKGSLTDVKIKGCKDAIYVNGGAPLDDANSAFYIHFNRCAFINNARNGFQATDDRPVLLKFELCEFRDNVENGYIGGGAGVVFDTCSITRNGSQEGQGGINILKTTSDSIPRGIVIRSCVFEANYNFEIWLQYVKGINITDNVFTPYENTDWTSTNKAIIKILSLNNDGFILGGRIEGNQIQNWSTTGQPIYWVYSVSSFGEIEKIVDTNNNYGSGGTVENQRKFVFQSLPISAKLGWQFNTSAKYFINSSEADIIDVTSGTKYLYSTTPSILAIASVFSEDHFNSNGIMIIPESSFYRVDVVLPITGLTAAHSGITLDIRVNNIQVRAVQRELPLPNGQRDAPISISEYVYLERGDAVTFTCNISGADTTPVNLKSDGNYLFSVSSV